MANAVEDVAAGRYTPEERDTGWSEPVVEHVDTGLLTRWRCTCCHCACDGPWLVIDPTDTGRRTRPTGGNLE